MYRGGVTDENAKDRKMETVDPLWHPLKGVAERRSIQKEKQNKVVELTIEKKIDVETFLYQIMTTF